MWNLEHIKIHNYKPNDQLTKKTKDKTNRLDLKGCTVAQSETETLMQTRSIRSTKYRPETSNLINVYYCLLPLTRLDKWNLGQGHRTF